MKLLEGDVDADGSIQTLISSHLRRISTSTNTGKFEALLQRRLRRLSSISLLKHASVREGKGASTLCHPSNVEWITLELGSLLAHRTRNSGALTVNQQVSVALHWLSSGAQYHTIADMHGVHKIKVCREVKRFVAAVNVRLSPRVVTWPQDIEQEAANFFGITRFP